MLVIRRLVSPQLNLQVGKFVFESFHDGRQSETWGFGGTDGGFVLVGSSLRHAFGDGDRFGDLNCTLGGTGSADSAPLTIVLGRAVSAG